MDLFIRSPFVIDNQMRRLSNTNQIIVPPPPSSRQSIPVLKRGTRGALVKRLQYILNRLGTKPVLPQTGYFGNKTWEAVLNFQTTQRIYPIDGEVGPKTISVLEAKLGEPFKETIASVVPGQFAEILAVVAEGQVGFIEESNNQGYEIEKYWKATNYPQGHENREPWCAAFVCWCMSEATQLADFKGALPTSARAYDFDIKWGPEQIGYVSVIDKPSIDDIIPGDILVYTFSHVGIAVEKPLDTGKVATVEGNTNDKGSREGDGVYRKDRSTSVIRSLVRVL